jgi:hypothetical protein
MLTATAPVMKAAPQGALRALGFGRVAVALGGCLLPDMPPADAGQFGSFGVSGNGGTTSASAKHRMIARQSGAEPWRHVAGSLSWPISLRTSINFRQSAWSAGAFAVLSRVPTISFTSRPRK